jgi:hypothetical protein
MGWQHTFIHEVAHRHSKPNERSYYNILTIMCNNHCHDGKLEMNNTVG